jgi:hypothetical protein
VSIDGVPTDSSFTVTFKNPTKYTGSISNFVIEWSVASGRRRATVIGRTEQRPNSVDPLTQVSDALKGTAAEPYKVVISTGLEPETEYDYILL